MHLYWLWATVGLLLLILEIFLGAQFFLFFLGSAILITAALGAIFSWESSTITWVGALLSIALLFIWNRLFKGIFHPLHDVNNPLLALKGSVAEVIYGDDPIAIKVKIGHTLWSARSADHKKMKKGDTVQVVGIEGVRLIVKSLQHDEK
ncbi:NfeD family protein [bacterium]|jgi:hypothetical protein|nr:NfeD family protein [bacterium]NBX72481.1 NfeD family protein [bacterium]